MRDRVEAPQPVYPSDQPQLGANQTADRNQSKRNYRPLAEKGEPGGKHADDKQRLRRAIERCARQVGAQQQAERSECERHTRCGLPGQPRRTAAS